MSYLSKRLIAQRVLFQTKLFVYPLVSFCRRLVTLKALSLQKTCYRSGHISVWANDYLYGQLCFPFDWSAARCYLSLPWLPGECCLSKLITEWCYRSYCWSPRRYYLSIWLVKKRYLSQCWLPSMCYLSNRLVTGKMLSQSELVTYCH